MSSKAFALFSKSITVCCCFFFPKTSTSQELLLARSVWMYFVHDNSCSSDAIPLCSTVSLVTSKKYLNLCVTIILHVRKKRPLAEKSDVCQKSLTLVGNVHSVCRKNPPSVSDSPIRKICSITVVVLRLSLHREKFFDNLCNMYGAAPASFFFAYPILFNLRGNINFTYGENMEESIRVRIALPKNERQN
jgi:hypothetical protein